MDAEKEKLALSILDQCLGKPVDQRFDDLGELCNHDQELIDRVSELLSFETKDIDSFHGKLDDSIKPMMSESFDEDSIKGYRFLKVLGRGGMGTVYLATRADGKHARKVAIKILMQQQAEANQLVKRFDKEQKILAGLHHPNIAQLYESGTTSQGFPYIIMEYVDGLPIHQYCKDKSVKDILKLFQQVCEAVSFAHQSLIVHRDIKPANILVNHNGEPKLLDFGIAKLLDNDGDTVLTRTNAMGPLTPEYASPEQFLGKNITTATDVWALGILLYEALTGVRPYQQGGELLSIMNAICSSDPLKPSTAMTKASGRMIGKERGRKLTGDLDNIILKCLRKEPQNRYASAQEIGNDIERHLLGYPVKATKGNRWYLLKKFAKRNYKSMSVAVLFLLTVVVFGVYVSKQNENIRLKNEQLTTERNRALRTTEFLMSIYDDMKPGTNLDRSFTIDAFLDIGREKVKTSFEDDPHLKSDLLMKIAGIYRSLGEYDDANALLEQALSIKTEAYGERHTDVADIYKEKGVVARLRGDLGLAEELLLKSLDIRGVTQDRQIKIAETQTSLAIVYSHMKKQDEALALHQQTLDAYLSEYGLNHKVTAETYANIGVTYLRLGQLESALEYLRKSKEIKEELYGADHIESALVLNNLGMVYKRLRQHSHALEALRSSLSILKKTYGDVHPMVAVITKNIGLVEEDRGQFGEASKAYDEVEAILTELHGEHDPALFSIYRIKGYLSSKQKLFEKALMNFDKAAFVYLKKDKSGLSTQYLGILESIAAVYRMKGDQKKSQHCLFDLLDKKQKLYGFEHIQNSISLRGLSLTYFEEQDYDEANLFLRDAIGNFYTNGNELELVKCYFLLSRTFYKQKLFEDFEVTAMIAESYFEKTFKPNYIEYASLMELQGDLQKRKGNDAKAKDYYCKAYDVFVAQYPDQARQVAEKIAEMGPL